MKFLDWLKNWMSKKKELADAKSEALHRERMKTVKEDAKLDNEMRLAKKKQRILALKQNTPKPSISSKMPISLGFGTTNTNQKKAKKNHSGSIMDLEI